MPGILAILEQRDGAIKKVSHEVLAAAHAAGGGEVHALVIGPAAVSGEGLGASGADKVFVAADDALKHYQAGRYAALAVDVARSGSYSAVLLGATALGKDLGPRIAARLGCPFVADVVTLTHAGQLTAQRPVYSGKALLTVKVKSAPCVVSVRPNVFAPVAKAASGAIARVPVPAPEAVANRATTIRVKEPERAALDVAEAPIVVSGGRGLQDPRHFHLLEELADALGNAAVGASRAVVDAGWRAHGDQVGQTGKTVSPSLYFAVGISGAIQHLAGMRTAKVIVAINKDKDAPIFKVADYGIVGDLFEILPRLTQEIKKLRAG
jgi:electron transfer flavoprotein alpha subunit